MVDSTRKVRGEGRTLRKEGLPDMSRLLLWRKSKIDFPDLD